MLFWNVSVSCKKIVVGENGRFYIDHGMRRESYRYTDPVWGPSSGIRNIRWLQPMSDQFQMCPSIRILENACKALLEVPTHIQFEQNSKEITS